MIRNLYHDVLCICISREKRCRGREGGEAHGKTARPPEKGKEGGKGEAFFSATTPSEECEPAASIEVNRLRQIRIVPACVSTVQLGHGRIRLPKLTHLLYR